MSDSTLLEDRIEQMLRLWPTVSEVESPEVLRQKLGELAHNGLTTADLRIRPFGRFQLSQGPFVSSSVTRAILWDECRPSDLWMAEFCRDAHSNWALRSLKPECQGCFKTGVISGNAVCPLCGGVGWGFADD